jgi:pantoate--beta-alanine ligase
MALELVTEISGLRAGLAGRRKRGERIGLVPTMGALHAGHGGLIKLARAQNQCVVVSIFVNPIQFNQASDYEKYPRTLDDDLEFCRARGVDFVFSPEIAEMYPQPQLAHVEVERVSELLCGRFRPGHFRGVATVVAKLFNLVQPDRAYFGEKDAQQLAVIRRMTKDLDFPIEIVEVPTVREPDGLALSSRNLRLTPEQRAQAVAIYMSLKLAESSIAAGVRDPREVCSEATEQLVRMPELQVEYFEVVDPEEMQPVEQIRGPVRVAAAVWAGSTRLIDNLLCRPPTAGPACTP